MVAETQVAPLWEITNTFCEATLNPDQFDPHLHPAYAQRILSELNLGYDNLEDRIGYYKVRTQFESWGIQHLRFRHFWDKTGIYNDAPSLETYIQYDNNNKVVSIGVVLTEYFPLFEMGKYALRLKRNSTTELWLRK
jgi:hypothetical protein